MSLIVRYAILRFVAELPSKSFYYPETGGEPAHRMCAAGQRLAASIGNDLLTPGLTLAHDKAINTAILTAKKLALGANVGKHRIITTVVVEKYFDGTLTQYVDSDGNFVHETHRGIPLQKNIFTEIATGKVIF